MVELGPYQFSFDPNELGDLFVGVAKVRMSYLPIATVPCQILKDESTLIDIDGEVQIFGNMEGSYR